MISTFNGSDKPTIMPHIPYCVKNQWWNIHLKDLFHITEINLHPVAIAIGSESVFTCNRSTSTFSTVIPGRYQPTISVYVSLINDGSAPDRHSSYWNYVETAVFNYRLDNSSNYTGDARTILTSVNAKDIALLSEHRQDILIARISVKGRGRTHTTDYCLRITIFHNKY